MCRHPLVKLTAADRDQSSFHRTVNIWTDTNAGDSRRRRAASER
jgi:hypothetical protein